MAFLASYDTLEDVPEHLRVEFAEGTDGKFRPAITAVEGWSLEDVTGLKSALQKKTTELRTSVAGTKEAQAERDALQTQVDAIPEGDDKAKDVQAQIDEVKRQLGETHTAETAKLTETLGVLKGQLQSSLIESAAIAAITHPDIKGNVDLLLPIVQSQARLVENDNGTVAVEIFDANGPRINSKADPMSFTDLLTDMRDGDKYAMAFEGSGQSGGDLKPTVGAGSGGSGKFSAEQVEKMSQGEFEKARADGLI